MSQGLEVFQFSMKHSIISSNPCTFISRTSEPLLSVDQQLFKTEAALIQEYFVCNEEDHGDPSDVWLFATSLWCGSGKTQSI